MKQISQIYLSNEKKKQSTRSPPSLNLSTSCRIFITLHWICIRCTVGNFLTTGSRKLTRRQPNQTWFSKLYFSFFDTSHAALSIRSSTVALSW